MPPPRTLKTSLSPTPSCCSHVYSLFFLPPPPLTTFLCFTHTRALATFPFPELTHDPKSHDSNVNAQGFIFPSCEALLHFFLILTLFSSFSAFLFLSQSSHYKKTPLPSFSLPFLLLLLQVYLTLTYTITSTCSHPPPTSPPQQFPASRYRQSPLSLGNTLLVLSKKQPRKPNSNSSC